MAKIIYTIQRSNGEGATLIEEGLPPERCAENIGKMLKVLFPPVEIKIHKRNNATK